MIKYIALVITTLFSMTSVCSMPSESGLKLRCYNDTKVPIVVIINYLIKKNKVNKFDLNPLSNRMYRIKDNFKISNLTFQQKNGTVIQANVPIHGGTYRCNKLNGQIKITNKKP